MQIIGSKGHTFTPRFTESKSVKMAANMAAKNPSGTKIRILIRLLLVSIHFNDRNLYFTGVIYFSTSIFVLAMLGSRYNV